MIPEKLATDHNTKIGNINKHRQFKFLNMFWHIPALLYWYDDLMMFVNYHIDIGIERLFKKECDYAYTKIIHRHIKHRYIVINKSHMTVECIKRSKN